MSNANAITIDALTRQFGDIVAVNDLSLTVEQGEIFGFLGPNGTGKSTTINILLGFLSPTSGSASILGHTVASESRAIRERIGLLPEGYEVYKNLTGREHIVSAIETKHADDDPDAIIERVGLDPSGVKRLRRIISEEVARGATVFFSSHILDEVERVCDRVGIMQNGTLVAVNSVDDLRSELGIESVVEATVARPPANLSMEDIDGIIEVTVDGTTVRVRCTHPAAKMRALRRIDDTVTVTDIAIEDGSLETIFEAYTTDETTASDVRVDEVEDATESVPTDTRGE